MSKRNQKPQQRTFEFSAGATTPSRARVSRKTNAPEPPAPRVFYTAEVYDQIKFLIAHCEKEVGWLGLVETTGNDYLVTTIYVPEQEVHGAETDIDNDAMAALANEILDANEDPSKLFYWGHSHVNMGVSPSGQDEQQVDEYLVNCPRFIRGIYNKKGDSKVDIFLREEGIVWQCCENRIYSPGIGEEQMAAFKKLIATNVKESTFPSAFPRTNDVPHWPRTDSYYRNGWAPPGTPGAPQTPAPITTGHRASNGAWLKTPALPRPDKTESEALTYDDLIDGFEYL